MNILLISQCDKRALAETRRILDQFAERRGERTWQTPITRDGLATLHKLLRASARKNTAVACHWIRGQDHSELLWVVGDKRRFNTQGAVPTNTTRRDVLRAGDENDWHSGEDIHLLTALAALLHDLGKGSQAFQMKLFDARLERNRYRHEWVSLRLFQAFVGQDDDATWLARLANPTPTDQATWLDWQSGRLMRDGLPSQNGVYQPPFQALAHAPLAQALGWLIVSHHRLPALPAHDENANRRQKWVGSPSGRFKEDFLKQGLQAMQADWNEILGPPAEEDEPAAANAGARTGAKAGKAAKPVRIEAYWNFPQGLPVILPHWQTQARRLALRLQNLLRRPDRSSGFTWLNEAFVMHLSRLALMLADHHYSSLNVLPDPAKPGQTRIDPARVSVPAGCRLWANTYRKSGQKLLPNQTLDEHLLGVAAGSRLITHALPSLASSLPGLVAHKPLRRRSQGAFAWQNQATEAAAGLRAQAAEHGAFIVNMASTGCGKTLANARVMNALADPEQGMRCAFALGLRTLTLQTGQAFRQKLELADGDLAIRVGGSASRQLFEHFESRAEATGSASSQALLLEEEEEGDVYFEGDSGLDQRHPLLSRALRDPHVKSLLVAPLLVCTIDHLTPATESQRGGRQIAPMLRLLTSDLVLDEPDDFDIADLPALTRLVHWAGLLGSRVLLSSATLAPALVQGLFMAYRAGRQAYQRHRGAHPARADSPPEIACLWLDEFRQQSATCATPEAFASTHQKFVGHRFERLTEAAQAPRRRLGLVSTERVPRGAPKELLYASVAALFIRQARELHRQHGQPDPQHPGCKVSFGLIRMANIEPLVQVALAMFRQGFKPSEQVHLCVYHSQFPLLVRSGIEQRLDAALSRHQPDAVFSLPDIRARLDAHPEAQDQLFIVLGSPVTEVGRDHDYDWAIVEPSSMRSLIQLAGRVRRHRASPPVTKPNVVLLNSNLKHLSQSPNLPAEPVFCQPGFETTQFKLTSHELNELVNPEDRTVPDARPRIQCRTSLAGFKSSWVDLEHVRLSLAMLPEGAGVPDLQVKANEAAWWCWRQGPGVMLTAMLPQHQPFRDDSRKRVEVCWRPSDEDPERLELTRVDKDDAGRLSFQPIEGIHETWPDEAVHGPGIRPWADESYAQALQALADELNMTPQRCAERFGTVRLPASDFGWRSHAVLGFVVK